MHDENQWYKDAIIYQLHVRAFFDRSGDGVGDFRGLTEKLDYIRDLGVTTIWLLPFYPSPLRDDGYDIAEYRAINPQYGTLDDFRRFLDEAHRRDLRVITELILNHTSDQHEWFQKSRRDEPGGYWREFYVWEQDPKKYAEARIIFQDFETSNWEWDPVASSYYWHRFYKHQPDLNYENPDVRQAVREVLDFWLEMGVDGFRLDAVPYLFERDGTSCENLPETHAFLKQIRSYIDDTYGVRPLMAEANQWPEDAAAYFGDGDECHMNFHFPLMPRLFMAVQREDRFPVVDILDQTPEIPDNCQWALFLRNHDELTLEMVTDEERDYMYRAYAEDPRARLNLGIRRRLMPLLGNSRRKLELMNGLLFSLPGTPIVYYGDEIGMGDNIYLGDRDGVRTPMQWSPDRNAGFSRANPQRLILPPIVDPEYHYTAINVEAQEDNQQSMLWWMRRLIALRSRHPVFGRGTFRFLLPENGHVLAFLREDEDETVLVVANLSRFAQFVELDLSDYRGRMPIEMFGKMRFPPIGELPYLLTLGSHSFYWFSLRPAQPLPEARPAEGLPTFSTRGRWDTAFEGRRRGETEAALLEFVQRQEWFEGRGAITQAASVMEVFPLTDSPEYSDLAFVLVRIDYANREPDTYLLPLHAVWGERQREVVENHPEQAVMWVHLPERGRGLIYDAAHENGFHVLCERAMREGLVWRGRERVLEARRTDRFDELLEGDAPLPQPRVLAAERGQECVNLGDRFHNRLLRRVLAGVNPELEIGRFLAGRQPPPPIPALAGYLEVTGDRGEPLTLAVLTEYIINEGTAWHFALDECRRFLEQSIAGPQEPSEPPVPADQPLLRVAWERRHGDPDSHDPFSQLLETMGRRVAEVHLALAEEPGSSAFRPEPLTSFSRRGLVQTMRSNALRALEALSRAASDLPEPLPGTIEDLSARRDALLDRYQTLRDLKLQVNRIRCHGDLDLRHLLYTGKDFVITDFRGDPTKPVSERRIKHSPLLDLAGITHSLYLVSRAGVALGGREVADRPESVERLSHAGDRWFESSRLSLLRGYLSTPDAERLLDARDAGQSLLLDAYLADRFVRAARQQLESDGKYLPASLAGWKHLLQTAAPRT